MNCAGNDQIEWHHFNPWPCSYFSDSTYWRTWKQFYSKNFRILLLLHFNYFYDSTKYNNDYCIQQQYGGLDPKQIAPRADPRDYQRTILLLLPDLLLQATIKQSRRINDPLLKEKRKNQATAGLRRTCTRYICTVNGVWERKTTFVFERI